jgi:uncharacterized Zn finger protein (UPF0148 family)
LLKSKSGQLYCARCQLPIKLQTNNDNSSIRNNFTENTPSKSEGSNKKELASLSSAPGFSVLSKELTEKHTEQLNDAKRSDNHLDVRTDHSLAATEAEIQAFENELFDEDYDQSEIDKNMKKINNLSSLLGAKMLAGCTLLGEQCPNPNCSCPLVQYKQGKSAGILECVQCNKQYKEDEHGEVTAINQPAAVAAAPAVTAAAAIISTNNKRPQAVTAINKVTSQSSSVEISENDEDSDDWALIQSKASNDRKSKISNVKSPFSSQSIADLVRNSNIASTHKPTQSNTNHAQSSTDVVSSKMSEKLLQGYTMLAEECRNPNCSCPLLRKRDGPKICVQCGQEDYNNTPAPAKNPALDNSRDNVNHQSPLQSPPLVAAHAKSAGTHLSPVSHKRARQISPQPTDEKSIEYHHTPVAVENSVLAALPTQAVNVPSVINLIQQNQSILTQSASAVLNKLQWATQQLSSTNDPRVLQQFAAAIQSLAEALKALQ